jgi:hypothetical protein
MRKTKKDIDKKLMFDKLIPSGADRNSHVPNSLQNVLRTSEEGVENNSAPAVQPTASNDAPVVIDEAAYTHRGQTQPQYAEPEKEEAEKKPAAVEVKTNVAPKEQYININEEMVKQKIDDAMDKFCCCKCELCRQDVTIMTLNNMTPNYMYIKPYETAAAAKKMDFSETTKALMKSILHVKTHARH